MQRKQRIYPFFIRKLMCISDCHFLLNLSQELQLNSMVLLFEQELQEFMLTQLKSLDSNKQI